MTNPPFRSEVQRVRQWCGPLEIGESADARSVLDASGALERRRALEVDAVRVQLGPIRSRSSLLSSFTREASPSEPVRTAYAIRWLELGPGIAATGVARDRQRRVMRPLLRRSA